MDEDDMWKQTCFILGLPRVGLVASCSFPYFLTFLKHGSFPLVKIQSSRHFSIVVSSLPTTKHYHPMHAQQTEVFVAS